MKSLQKHITENQQINEGFTSKELLGKSFDPYGKGLITIINFGDENLMYQQADQRLPANPMGYAKPSGNYWLVKDEFGRYEVLNPSFEKVAKKYFDGMKNIKTTDFVQVKKIDKNLKVDSIIYYKDSGNNYVKGEVVDHFGDGIFVIMDKPVTLDGNHKIRDFEIFTDDTTKIKNLYIKK